MIHHPYHNFMCHQTFRLLMFLRRFSWIGFWLCIWIWPEPGGSSCWNISQDSRPWTELRSTLYCILLRDRWIWISHRSVLRIKGWCWWSRIEFWGCCVWIEVCIGWRRIFWIWTHRWWGGTGVKPWNWAKISAWGTGPKSKLGWRLVPSWCTWVPTGIKIWLGLPWRKNMAYRKNDDWHFDLRVTSIRHVQIDLWGKKQEKYFKNN